MSCWAKVFECLFQGPVPRSSGLLRAAAAAGQRGTSRLVRQQLPARAAAEQMRPVNGARVRSASLKHVEPVGVDCSCRVQSATNVCQVFTRIVLRYI